MQSPDGGDRAGRATPGMTTADGSGPTATLAAASQAASPQSPASAAPPPAGAAAPVLGHRADIGVASYGRIAWLAPPPPLRQLVHGDDGTVFVWESGISADPDVVVQEGHHPGDPGSRIVLVADAGQSWEGTIDSRRIGPRPRQVSALQIGAGSEIRWVTRRGFRDAMGLMFPPEVVARHADALGTPLRALPTVTDGGGRLTLLGAALVQDARSGPLDPLAVSSYATLFLRLALLGPAGGGPPARGGLAGWQVRRVTDYLEAHAATDIRLSVLAGLVDLSDFHFCRAFRVSTGVSPSTYVQRLRIERAKRLLSASSLPVIDVAAAVGYGSPAHFARIFRRETGVSPRDWRRRIGD